MVDQKLILILSHSLIGTGFFFLYVNHVRSIFETRTSIAELTTLERESLFRREDALYYSFYKTLVEAPNFWVGFEQLQNVSGIEYPNNVNVLRRFEVYPELAIAYMYHNLKSALGQFNYFPFFSCWVSGSNSDMPMELRGCDNFGHPMQFYLEMVWIVGGLTILVIYLYGTLMCLNIFGGIYAVVSYVMFHSFASKIYERPLARENFAFPVIFVQIFYLTVLMERVTATKENSLRLFVTVKLAFLSAFALILWQFSSIIFATQILIMMIPWSCSYVSSEVAGTFTMDYAISQMLSIGLAFLMSFGNKKYIYAWQAGPAVGLFFTSIVRRMTHQGVNTDYTMKTLTLSIVMATSSAQGRIIEFLEKIGFSNSIDNTFAMYRDLALHWGLQAKVNFVTSFLACNEAYNRMTWDELWELLKTLIVKPYCLYGVVVLAKFFRNLRKSNEKKNPDDDFIERAKKYVLEDFLEENHISMRDMSNKETEDELNECLKLLEQCEYDYERYKTEKGKLKKDNGNEHNEFMNDVRKLKEEINDNEKKSKDSKDKESGAAEMETEAEENDNDGSNDDDDDASTDSDEPSVSNVRQRRNRPRPKDAKRNGAEPSSASTPRPAGKSSSSKVPHDGSEPDDFLSFHYLYSFYQMAAFTVIGLSIKKLFFLCFTQGCVVAPTVIGKFTRSTHSSIFWSVSLAVFLTSMIDPGLRNIREEYFPTANSHHSDDLDTMLEWIRVNTEKDAVFAGPVEIIGTVHLTTKRPIVNHANLEMRQMQDRTEQVYSLYSRQQSSDIYNHCTQLKIQYLIVSLKECSNQITDECDTLSIWDDMQPTNRKYSQFCSELINKNIPSFLKVFTNDYYAIIKMFSQSVQINLKYNKMPEKVM